MQTQIGLGKKRTALGQGLNALIPLDKPLDSKITDSGIVFLPIDSLSANPFQPRRLFSQESLSDLSNSIKEIGVIQPLIVRSNMSGDYEIVAGERRWRAARMAGFSTIPVVIRQLSDAESLEIALIENIQRENLNPLDTAEAYEMLIRKFSYTQEALAQRIGKDRTSITNHLRLLKLPDPIKEHLRQDQLSMGHARTLLAVEDISAQLTFSRKVIKRKLSVRELERIVLNFKQKRKNSKTLPDTMSYESRLQTGLSRHLATKVLIKKNTNSSGKLELFFDSTDELARLLDLLGYSEDFS